MSLDLVLYSVSGSNLTVTFAQKPLNPGSQMLDVDVILRGDPGRGQGQRPVSRYLVIYSV